MLNLESIGLALLLVLLIVGVSLYVSMTTRTAPKRLVSLTETDNDYETAGELFPEISFPSDMAKEPVPELPRGYNDNKIVAMARDPEWIFTYWEISEEKWRSLRDTCGPGWDSSLPALRVYEVTGIDYFNGTNANGHFDIVVNDYAGSWYIHVGSAEKTYCVDIGRVLSDGTFITVTRSNFTSTPRNMISDRVDPDWLLVSEDERRLLANMGQQQGISSAEFYPEVTSSAELFNRN